MKRSFFRVVLCTEQSSGIVPLLLLLVGLGIGMAGCNHTDSANYAGSDSAAPSLKAAVPDALQSTVQHQIEQFVADLQKTDYAKIQQQMTPALRKQAPKTQADWVNHGNYQPLIGASNWKYDLTQLMGGGKEIVVHTSFTGADGGSYHTNFIFRKDGDSWLIDSILSPTKQVRPLTQKSSGTSAIPGH